MASVNIDNFVWTSINRVGPGCEKATREEVDGSGHDGDGGRSVV